MRRGERGHAQRTANAEVEPTKGVARATVRARRATGATGAAKATGTTREAAIFYEGKTGRLRGAVGELCEVSDDGYVHVL